MRPTVLYALARLPCRVSASRLAEICQERRSVGQLASITDIASSWVCRRGPGPISSSSPGPEFVRTGRAPTSSARGSSAARRRGQRPDAGLSVTPSSSANPTPHPARRLPRRSRLLSIEDAGARLTPRRRPAPRPKGPPIDCAFEKTPRLSSPMSHLIRAIVGHRTRFHAISSKHYFALDSRPDRADAEKYSTIVTKPCRNSPVGVIRPPLNATR